jgi:uncharacterized DUF497 family protein
MLDARAVRLCDTLHPIKIRVEHFIVAGEALVVGNRMHAPVRATQGGRRENCIWHMVDDRSDYDEVREVAFGPINDRLFVSVYADRDAEQRVISLGKANKREVKRCDEIPE